MPLAPKSVSKRMPRPGRAEFEEWERQCAALRASVEAGDRPEFVARATADGAFWYVEIDGVPRLGLQPVAFTQARSLEEIEPMARDVTATVLDIPPECFDLRVAIGQEEA